MNILDLYTDCFFQAVLILFALVFFTDSVVSLCAIRCLFLSKESPAVKALSFLVLGARASVAMSLVVMVIRVLKGTF